MPEKCDGCFLECEAHKMVRPNAGNPYPCSDGMRAWAAAHKNDRGDALGYVREVRDDRRRY